jgi:hypothetical protein
MISHLVKSDCDHFSEYLKTNIKEADRPMFLDPLCLINLR